MQLSYYDDHEKRVIEVGVERIDAAMSIRFKDEVRKLAEDAPERVVLDLKNVKFIDSSGIGSIVAIMKLITDEHKLELAHLSDFVKSVFKLTRLDSIFTLHDSLPSPQ